MKKISVSILLPLLVGHLFAGGAPENEIADYPLVELVQGMLQYNSYSNYGELNSENVLPDFSFAGYKRGGVPLPAVEVAMTLSPVEGDNSVQIQEAIDKIGQMAPDVRGIRGAVLLKKGRYTLEQSLFMNQSGVILRGEGQGEEGTVLYDSIAVQHNTITLGGDYSLTEVNGTKSTITSEFNGVGSREITVTDASLYKAGDTIAIVRTPNEEWIKALRMTQWGWEPDRYVVTNERVVTGVSENTLTFEIPLVDAIQTRYGGGYVYKIQKSVTVQNSGIESLRMVSYYKGNTDEEHGWAAVDIRGAQNCWIKNITAQFYGYSTVNMAKDSHFNTVQDSAYLEGKSVITGGRRYPFAIQKGTGNLFQRCYTDEGRHDFVTGSLAAGPNVFLDCYSEGSHADTGPHHRWATGVLFDNVKSNELAVENRQDAGTGHGWSGAQIIFWNCVSKEITCDTPRGAMNFSMGSKGTIIQGGWDTGAPRGYFYSHETPVEIRSLYIQQLKDRLGQEALDNVLIQAQKEGPIFDYLKEWAGSY